MNLQKLSYEDAEVFLKEKSDSELIAVLDGTSRKLGDTAWSLLLRRKRQALVMNALRDDQIRTRDGKIRSLNMLKILGRSEPESFEVFKLLATDRSADVSHSALFGLCLWGKQEALPFLRSIRTERTRDDVDLAIRSIEAGNYNIFSSGFRDASGVWNRPSEQDAAVESQR